MTLRDSCELWVTFDSEDVDASRGIVYDRSGKGRTLEASGGPTYNVDSPVGEAVNLDGTDDDFTNFDSASTAGATEWTLAAISRWDGGNAGDSKFVHMHGKFTARINHDSTDVYKASFVTPNAVVSMRMAGEVNEDEYVLVVGTFNAGDGRAFVDGDLKQTDSVSDTQLGDNGGPTNNYIGRTPSSGSYFSGDVSLVAEWSRELSYQEIQQLNRMTDRMVSRL